MKQSPSSSHCVLNGKNDGDMNLRNKGCVRTPHMGWSSSTTNTLMNERLTKSRDHGWSKSVGWRSCESTQDAWTSYGANKSGDWSIPAHSKYITKVSNSNKSNDVSDQMGQSFQFENPIRS